MSSDRHTLTDAIKGLGCPFETPVPGQEVFIVNGLAAKFGLDPKLAQARLRDEFPHRSGEDEILWGQPQWVRGDHVALKYRGNTIAREKMWFQSGDPREDGFLKYLYTGWQWRVMPATANVQTVPWLEQVTNDVNAWLAKHGQRPANHYIVTAYEKEDCGIGMHYDKEKTIDPKSVIIVVKTGECGRPFRITENNKGGEDTNAELFNEVVEPGDAVIMTMAANLATKHGVPILQQPTGASCSIVMRTITQSVPWKALEQRLAKQGQRNAALKRARED